MPISAISRCFVDLDEAILRSGAKKSLVQFRTSGGIMLYCAISDKEADALSV